MNIFDVRGTGNDEEKHRKSVLHDTNLSYEEISAKKAQNFFLLNKKRRLEKIEQLRTNKRFKQEDETKETEDEDFKLEKPSILDQNLKKTDDHKKFEENFINYVKDSSSPLEISLKFHELLTKISSCIKERNNFIHNINVYNCSHLLNLTKILRKCLSLKDIEKFELVTCILLSDDWDSFYSTISSVFPLPTDNNIIQKDMRILLFSNFNELLSFADGELQVEVCWCIANICCSIFSSNVEMIISAFGPKLVQYLIETKASPDSSTSEYLHQNPLLMEQCCGAIGNGAGDNEGSARDMLIKMGAIHPLLQIVKTQAPRPSLQLAAAWALSNLLKPSFNSFLDPSMKSQSDHDEQSLKIKLDIDENNNNMQENDVNNGMEDEDQKRNQENLEIEEEKEFENEFSELDVKNNKYFMSEDEKYEYFFCDKNMIDLACFQIINNANGTPISRLQTEFSWILSCLTTHHSKRILSRFLNENFCKIVEEKLKFTEIEIEEIITSQNSQQNLSQIQKIPKKSSNPNPISEILLMQIPLIRFFGNLFSHPLIEQPQILQILKTSGQVLSQFCIKKLKIFFFNDSVSPNWNMILSNFDVCLVQTKEILWFLSTLFLVENEECVKSFVEIFGFLGLLTKIAHNLVVFKSSILKSSSNSALDFEKQILCKIDRKTKYEILRETCFSILNLINNGKFLANFFNFKSPNSSAFFHPFALFSNHLLREAIFFHDARSVDTCFTFLIFVRQFLGKEQFLEIFQESEGNLKKAHENIEHFVFHKEKYIGWMGADLVEKSHSSISNIFDELENEQ